MKLSLPSCCRSLGRIISIVRVRLILLGQAAMMSVAIASDPPSWVPTEGTISNISLNNLSEVNPCPTNNCWYRGYGLMAPWRNWSGAAWAPDFSSNGALVFMGGGHGGGEDWGLYVFDFTTRLWSRKGPAMPATNPFGVDANPGPTWGNDWHDALVDGSYVVNGSHTYNMPAYIPANKPGAGSQGSWLLPMSWGNQTGGGAKSAPHAVNLTTGVWTRATQTSGVLGGIYGPYSGSIEDTTRGVIIWSGYNAEGYSWIDLNEAPPRTLHRAEFPWQFYWPLWYGRFIHVPEANLTIGFGRDSDTSRVVAKLMAFPVLGEKPVVTDVALPARTVASPGFGMDWNPHTKKFYLYTGSGSATVAVLTPSSLNFTTCTWSWSEETFTGAAPAHTTVLAGSGGEVPLGRWRYIPALRCFAWSDGSGYSAACVDGVTRNGVMQLWRPLEAASVPTSSATWPAWRSAMKTGTWSAIPATNTITAIDPAKNSAFNPNLPGNTSAPWSGVQHIGGVIAPWCGGTFDEATDTLWLPLSGGHQDYAGNEAYRISLGTASPAWSSPRPPSGSIPLGLIALNDGKESSGDYADGRPRAIHSYNKHVFVPGVGNILAVQGSTYLSGQSGTSRTLLLNSTTGEWSHLATHPAPGVEYGGSCYDSLRHRIWWLPSAQGRLSYFDLATNTWTVLASSTYLDEWSYTRPVYVPGTDVIVQLQKNLTGNIGVWNLATAQRTTPGTTNAPPASVSNLGAAGFAWVPALNAFCLWGNSTATTTIHTLSPPATGDWKTQPWTWGTLTLDPANTVVPTVACATGTYGRFGYSPNLNGFFLLNAVNQPVYFYALGAAADGIVAPSNAIISITVE